MLKLHIDGNKFTNVGGTYKSINMMNYRCSTSLSSIYRFTDASLSIIELNSLDFSILPSKIHSIVIEGVTHEYNLNHLTFSNNSIAKSIFSGLGMFRLTVTIASIISNNTISKTGYYVESLFREMNPNMDTPISTCSDYSRYVFQLFLSDHLRYSSLDGTSDEAEVSIVSPCKANYLV